MLKLFVYNYYFRCAEINTNFQFSSVRFFMHVYKCVGDVKICNDIPYLVVVTVELDYCETCGLLLLCRNVDYVLQTSFSFVAPSGPIKRDQIFFFLLRNSVKP